jgi:1-phosphofructokinase
MSLPSVALFAPHPLLTVTLEVEGGERQSIHFHAGGQGVWVASMARCMGTTPVLCGFIGGESGELMLPLIEKAAGEQTRLVQAASASGCYVTDRRSGRRELLAMKLSDPPSRHELDELFSLTCSQALACGWLVVTNPLPGESLPLEVYGDLVADARSGGCRTLVDLSSPRLDSALASEPDLVKINDWELAEFVRGSVSTPELLLAGAQRLRDAGAQSVVVTRGELPALVLHRDAAWRLTPPRFEHGFREGCGDAMMGALAAVWARGGSFERALVLGAAAGAANFLRRGLGHASREVVEQLADAVTLEPWASAEERPAESV